LNSLEAAKISAINTAMQIDSSVQSNELPEQNEKMINEIDWLFQLQGVVQISVHQSQLIDIANQCPFEGGKAVYRARALLSAINSDVAYDDLSICLSEGIYRSVNTSLIKAKQEIILKPNPTSEYTEVLFSGYEIGICTLSIFNEVNQVVGSFQFNCADKKFRLNTANFSPGVYTVRIVIDNADVVTSKLIIVR